MSKMLVILIPKVQSSSDQEARRHVLKTCLSFFLWYCDTCNWSRSMCPRVFAFVSCFCSDFFNLSESDKAAIDVSLMDAVDISVQNRWTCSCRTCLLVHLTKPALVEHAWACCQISNPQVGVLTHLAPIDARFQWFPDAYSNELSYSFGLRSFLKDLIKQFKSAFLISLPRLLDLVGSTDGTRWRSRCEDTSWVWRLCLRGIR